MLWNATALNGYAIEANDGVIGNVKDLLFEDTTFVIRWLVVDTGNATPRRDVLLPISALGKPNASKRKFPVSLTMQQVRDGPDIETNLPVSRQIEEKLYNYYGWNPYWRGNASLLSNTAMQPFVVPLDMVNAPRINSDKIDAEPYDGDPSLRSVAFVTSYNIDASDGQIGHADDFIVQDGTWHIRYMIVDTKNSWPGEKVLIPTRALRQIDWENKSIHLNIDRQMVKHSPLYNPTMTADSAYDEAFLTYFGVKWVEK